MIVYNNETIKNLIMDALDKNERGIEINEVDRNELINVILKYGDSDFGIKNGNRTYTEEELQNSIYIHIFENNKCYIGQTKNIEERWKYNGINYKTQLVYRAIEKYGWTNTSHIVICNGLTNEQVNDMEVALISIFKSTNGKFGYNVQNGGNNKGKHSEETRKKMSENMKGKYVGEKNPMYGKPRSEETKNKISEANKGENNGMYGKHFLHSEETKNKISEAHKGKPRSEESKKKQSETIKGGNNHNAKKVYCDGKIFQTINQCAKFYNISTITISRWLNGDYKKLSELLKKGLRFATQEDIEKYPHCKEENENKIIEVEKRKNSGSSKKVYCNGMIFKSKKQCAEFYKVKLGTMGGWLLGRRKTPSEFIELGLRYATIEDINTYPLYIEKQNQQDQ